MQTAGGVKHQVQPAGGVEHQEQPAGRVEYQDNLPEEQNIRYDLLEE
jgi:hypothetical protein